MSFWDKVGKMAGAIVEKVPGIMKTTQEHQVKTTQNQTSPYEKKVQKLKRNSGDMHTVKREPTRQHVEQYQKDLGIDRSPTGELLYGDFTIDEWDGFWGSIGRLKTANLTPYNEYVGLYRHVIDGKVMYVGRAIEFNDGGFEKRLTDERKSLASARQHKSGQFIYEHLDQITTDILVVGETQEDVRLTKVLEGKFIARFRPPWNKQ